MTRAIIKSFLMVFFLSLGLACATTGSVAQLPLTEGTFKKFSATQSEVIEAARAAIPKVGGLKIKSESKLPNSKHMILSETPVSGWSWGEVVRVIIEPMGDDQAGVWVLNKRKHGGNVTAEDFTASVFSNIEYELEK